MRVVQKESRVDSIADWACDMSATEEDKYKYKCNYKYGRENMNMYFAMFYAMKIDQLSCPFNAFLF